MLVSADSRGLHYFLRDASGVIRQCVWAKHAQGNEFIQRNVARRALEWLQTVEGEDAASKVSLNNQRDRAVFRWALGNATAH